MLNGISVGRLIGQRWTLRLEAILYLLIPALAFTYRRTRSVLAMAGLLATVSIVQPFFAFFSVGAAAVDLAARPSPIARLGWKVTGLFGLPLFAVVAHGPHNWLGALPLGCFFIALLQGGWGFAWLGWRPLCLLGTISYSIHLTHGFAGWVVEGFLPSGRGDLLVMEAAKLTASVLLGSLAYVLIERPFLSSSIKALSPRRPPASRPPSHVVEKSQFPAAVA